MVEKVTSESVHWVCRICREFHYSEEEAKKCESQGYVKIKLGEGSGETQDWDVGDMAIVHIHDRGDFLGMIVAQQREQAYRHSHKIIPKWLFLDLGLQVHDTWGYESVTWITPAVKHRIARWIMLMDKAKRKKSSR